jgi:hypothetical protein
VNSGAEVTDEGKKSYLISQLKGTAALWLEGLAGDWVEWDYARLVQELRDGFETAQTSHAERLKALKMRDQDLAKFNSQFWKLAIGAKQVLSDYSINELYALAVRPTVLSDWLQMWRDLPLTKLQAKALQLESSAVAAANRGRVSNNYNTQGGGYSNRPQDPNRHKCPKCNTWHFKDGPCPTPAQIKARLQHQGQRTGGNRPRSQDGHLATEEGALDQEELG